MSAAAQQTLASLWRQLALDDTALERIDLPQAATCLPSSFHVGIAAQASIGAAALAAETLYHLRCGRHQHVTVTRRAAELECTGYFKLDGETPNAWEMFSGLYATSDGHVRIHANFEHHRDGVLSLLGVGGADEVEREDLSRALANWTALGFEDAAAERGLVVAMVRSFEEWDRHPHAIANVEQPLIKLTKLDQTGPQVMPPLSSSERPLTGLKVLDLTRILAGPICGRTLAANGADVMLVNSPNLPNISSITDTSRGKRSAHIDLTTPDGIRQLKELAKSAHVFVQGYRPGGLASKGFAAEDLAALRPGIVCVSLSAYGSVGPWAERRGFDSLVQTATGFNHAEALAADADAPKPMPVQILDYASGFLMAFGAQAALWRQANEGGSWHVQVSLLQTANWLRSLGRTAFDAEPMRLRSFLEEFPCDHGRLEAMPHAAQFSTTQATWQRASSLPGTHSPSW